MADDLTFTPGSGASIATDDCTSGHVQLVKLAYAADGTRTHVPADADGILVNLGTNNDVTITSGTVTAVTAITNALPAGTNNIGDVDVLTLPALPAGTNNIGDVDILSIAAGDNNIGNVDVVTLPNVTIGTMAALVAGTANIGDVDVLTVPAPLSTTGGGTEATALRVTLATDSTGVVSVDDNGAALTVDNGGTFAVQVDGNALTALQLIDNPVLVDDAAFAPATSSVMMAGFQVDDTATDSVDEGDAGAARMTLDRRQIVQLGETGAKDVVGGGSKTDTTDQSIMAALASNFNYLCWLTVYNASATNTFATLKDGATTRAIIPLPAYGGAIFMPPRGIRATANTAWNVAAGASVTTAYFYGGGFTCQS
jgi:hypothetical protein